MAIRWAQVHWGNGATAYDGHYLIGQVARFDVTPFPGSVGKIGIEYRAYLRGQPVNGPKATLAEAQQLVEQAATGRAAPRH